MATNNFKPFAIGSGANVTSQSDYENLDALLKGFQSGKASSAQINKALRQATSMSALLGKFIAAASLDALDNGNQEVLLANYISALASNLSLGTASKKNVGTGTDQIPDMSSFFGATTSAPYQRFPSGLLIQAASGSIPASGTGAIVFPAAFKNNSPSVVLTATASLPSNYIITVGSVSASGATIYGTTANAGSVPITGTAVGFRYIAFGY
ncbi:hypothetical protein IFU25_08250 [Pantoea agglomerans]|uniref:Uncharacterized protein n=1 Tax=Enterobacter agglomerans TaxID=549 RepID=A0ACC5PWH5_ENTAG|nr:hypothetical protein [Pantoea agglomerans]MBD8129209.1 hypothetical protein [Pantoea agglomerans]MBD8181693.1 hypothetical protein [Pantoea agglomerans]